jgi:hypothetical protein
MSTAGWPAVACCETGRTPTQGVNRVALNQTAAWTCAAAQNEFRSYVRKLEKAIWLGSLRFKWGVMHPEAEWGQTPFETFPFWTLAIFSAALHTEH